MNKSNLIIAQNRKAKFNYQITEKIEVGIVLSIEHKVVAYKDTLGAKVAWKSGAYWTPVEQLSKVGQ